MSASVAEADSAELESLFDNIAAGRLASVSAAAPGAARPLPAGEPHQSASVMSRVGHLTRMLHDALRELGYDRLLEKTAASIPDARDRLAYVAQMTEQAAVRALNATEAAQPIQERLGSEAERLSAQWQRLFDRQMDLEEFKSLVSGTCAYLAEVPAQARATNAQLLEIIMAQDFQDLTGQVIKKITAIAQDMEDQLVQLLVDLVPAEMRGEISSGLLNGPVVNPSAGSEVVTSQNQVDDLLASLGF